MPASWLGDRLASQSPGWLCLPLDFLSVGAHPPPSLLPGWEKRSRKSYCSAHILHFLRTVCREGPVLFPEVAQLQLGSASPTRLASLPLHLPGQRDLVLPNPELFEPLRSNRSISFHFPHSATEMYQIGVNKCFKKGHIANILGLAGFRVADAGVFLCYLS